MTTPTQAALDAAIRAANAQVFQTSVAHPVVIEFDASLINQTIHLTQALPPLAVDYVTVRVAGAGPLDRLILDGSQAPVVMRLSGRHVVVQNISFQYGGPGVEQDVCSASGTDDVTFTSCDFDGSSGNSLWLVGCTNTTLQDCGFHHGGNGLAATSGTTGINVMRCTFADNQEGVLLSVGHNVQIRDCLFDHNGTAVNVDPVCVGVTIGPNNMFFHTTPRAAVLANGTALLNILSNQFIDNDNSAIQLGNLCAAVSLTNNTMSGNGLPSHAYQLAIQDCRNVQIQGLQCAAGGAGLYAGNTQQLTIAGTTISGHDAGGVVLNGCSAAVVDQVTVSGNLVTGGGVHFAMYSCHDVDVTNTTVSGATGPGCIGMMVADSGGVRVGCGSAVLDHGGQGVLVTNSTDLVLGNWAPGNGALAVRGPSPLQVNGGTRVQIVGAPGAPCTLTAGSSAPAMQLSSCPGSSCGPDVAIDGQRVADSGLQVIHSDDCRLTGIQFTGHVARGLVAADSRGLQLSGCTVDGGPAGGVAEGLLFNPGCDGARLLGNVVRRQAAAFAIVESDDVWVGPGNLALDNNGDAFMVIDNGPSPGNRHVTIQSAVAVGRGVAVQNGFHAVNVRLNLTNVTATRNGTGVMLQRGAQATMVNVVSWGNGTDRSRDPSSSGTWRSGLIGTSFGGWSDQDLLVGQDPRFVAAANGDVHLQPGSPAIDSGLHATPVGAGLPCVDADLQPRVRGGTVDRGAYEAASGAPNTLDLAGPWLRPAWWSPLDFTVQRTPAEAGQLCLLLCSGSGTGPGFGAPGGNIAPLVPDLFTGLLLSVSGWCVGNLDAGGRADLTLPLPPYVVPLLPELSFSAVFAPASVSTNPVVVRFLP